MDKLRLIVIAVVAGNFAKHCCLFFFKYDKLTNTKLISNDKLTNSKHDHHCNISSARLRKMAFIVKLNGKETDQHKDDCSKKNDFISC